MFDILTTPVSARAESEEWGPGLGVAIDQTVAGPGSGLATATARVSEARRHVLAAQQTQVLQAAAEAGGRGVAGCGRHLHHGAGAGAGQGAGHQVQL